MKKIFTLLTAVIMVLGLTVSANATLLDRGGGLIYDDDFNITWLQDANYAQTSGYDSDGLMNWNDAMTWASNLVYEGYNDWRLPTALNQDGSGVCGSIYNCTSSEMGHLYYAAPPDGLGNVAWFSGCTFGVDCGLVNTGPFTNLQANTYWSSTECAPGSDCAWDFYFSLGGQFTNLKVDYYYALAVRPGDSAPIPEPATILLLGSGLVGLGVFRKKLKK